MMSSFGFRARFEAVEAGVAGVQVLRAEQMRLRQIDAADRLVVVVRSHAEDREADLLRAGRSWSGSRPTSRPAASFQMS